MEHHQNRRNLQYSMPSSCSQFVPKKNLKLISLILCINFLNRTYISSMTVHKKVLNKDTIMNKPAKNSTTQQCQEQIKQSSHDSKS